MESRVESLPVTDHTWPARIDLFGMPLHVVGFDDTLDLLVRLAQGEHPAYVVTSNVDHVVRYHRCSEVRSLYTNADLVVADGMPVVWATRLLGRPVPERVTGSDLFPALCERAASIGLSVFLLGGAEGTARRAAEVMQAQYPRLRFAGTYCPPYGFEQDPAESKRVVDAVRTARPDILFVGLGAPKQENWIVANRDACGAKLSIGVGISFSFVSGHVARAPRWMQRAGLEWLHRLNEEPRRLWKRYLVEDLPFFYLLVKDLMSQALNRGDRSHGVPGARTPPDIPTGNPGVSDGSLKSRM